MGKEIQHTLIDEKKILILGGSSDIGISLIKELLKKRFRNLCSLFFER